MTQVDKIINRFLQTPPLKDLTFEELTKVMAHYSYLLDEKGSGSRVLYFNEETKDKLRIHKPHPGNILKTYVVKIVQEKLKELRREQWKIC